MPNKWNLVKQKRNTMKYNNNLKKKIKKLVTPKITFSLPLWFNNLCIELNAESHLLNCLLFQVLFIEY